MLKIPTSIVINKIGNIACFIQDNVQVNIFTVNIISIIGHGMKIQLKQKNLWKW